MFAKIAAKRRGFTLIELLVVIVIIAVLALIAIPRFQDAGQRSKESSLRSDLALLRTAIGTYYTDTGTFPTLLSDLAQTTAPTNGIDKAGNSATIDPATWHGPYIQSVPNDPVMAAGTPFNYVKTGTTTGTVNSTSTASGLNNGGAYNTW